MDARIKSIIDNNFDEVRGRTGLKLSYGNIARSFWSALAEDPKLRKKCMDAVCKTMMENAQKNKRQPVLWEKKPKRAKRL
jgi:hypothetical protein